MSASRHPKTWGLSGLPAQAECANHAGLMLEPDLATLAILTQTALTVAQEAATLVMRGYRSRPTVDRKANYADLVTEYDVASERLIRARLGELTPDVPVVGEEEGGLGRDELTWYCDPIDGTVNFAHGHPFFAVSIGLLRRGQPLGGAVVAPALHTVWHGFAGGGAFRNGVRCHVSDTTGLADAMLATGISPLTGNHGHPEDNLAAFARIVPQARAIRRCGSAALDMCLVADGTYDAYWERRLAAWDIAAGAALVLAAGGRITDLLGAAPDLTRGYVVASNGRVHDALVELLRQDGAPTTQAGSPP